MDLALRNMGFDPQLLDVLHDLIDFFDETDQKSQPHAPSLAYVRDSKAMNATPADVKEYPNFYVFLVDMPDLKPDQIKVLVKDNNVLVVSGERKREKEKDQKDGVKYLKMERRVGRF